MWWWMMVLMLTGERVGAQVVTLAQGPVRGVRHDGYITYSGIPYARIVDDDGRFKPAGIAPSWSGIRESSPVLSSYHHRSLEECLQLEVHVPEGAPATPWPVLVWIPSGSGHYHPGMFVKEGLVVVYVNYRSGPLGFLCLNHDKVPGNAGVKDLVLALRWVQDNIVAFSGSPSRVVVGGQSFAAAAIEALMLTSMSEGLFNGAILQSGSVLSPWAFNYDAEYRATQLAHMFTDSDDTDDLVTVLLNAELNELTEKAKLLELPYLPFGICVERQLKSGGVLLESPLSLLESKKVLRVPILMGYNTDEAYIFTMNLKTTNVVKKMKQDLTFLLPHELVFFDKDEPKQVVKQFKDMYFKNNLTIAAVLTYHRDVYFVQHVYRSARLHEQANELPVYLYQFSHASTPGVEPVPGVNKAGAAHSDELAYLFPDKGRTLEGEDGVIQQRLVKLWTNFVKHLDPTSSEDPVKWEPLNAGPLRVLNIGNELEMRDFPYASAMQLWENVYDKFYYRRYNDRDS